LNILGGLTVGIVGFWAIQSYMQGKEMKQASQKVLTIVEKKAIPVLKPFEEKYDGIKGDGNAVTEVVQGIDTSKPICPVGLFADYREYLPDLYPRTIVIFADLMENLQQAELLRKLLDEQQKNPELIHEMIERELLRSLYEGYRLSNRIVWNIKEGGGE